MVVVPEWTPDGAFTINYSNAIEYEPETRVNQIGVSYKAFNLGEAFGTHPLLSQAWRDQATAQLLLQLSTLPFQTREDRRLAVRVSSAEPNHRGKLVLDRNQAGTVAAGISEAKFSLVGFQDFIAPGRQQASLKNLTEEDMVTLNALAEKLEDDAKISVSGTARKLVLDSGEGWSATLTKDTGPTRDSVSHTGIISRPDGGSFNPGEIEEILRAITYFLAFVAGKYTHPSAVIEFDSSHKSVWGRIGRVGIDSKRTYNWFVNNVEAPDGWILENLFPKFWEKWKANTNELVAIIDCYVASNAMVTSRNSQRRGSEELLRFGNASGPLSGANNPTGLPQGDQSLTIQQRDSPCVD